MDRWGTFDVFEAARLSGDRPLCAVGLAVLQALGLVQQLQLPLGKLTCFLQVGAGSACWGAAPWRAAADVQLASARCWLAAPQPMHSTARPSGSSCSHS